MIRVATCLLGSLLPMSVSGSTATFDVSNEMLANNPLRGMYLPLDTGSSILSKTNAADFVVDGVEVNLVRYLLPLNAYCDKLDISSPIAEMKTVMQHLAGLGKRAVFRFFYTPLDGSKNSCGHYYPASVSIATSHIQDIAAEIVPEAISFIEAGVIGPWGEWHAWGLNGFVDHTILSQSSNRVAISYALKYAFHPFKVLVRRPVFKLENEAQTNSVVLGQHNDCFLSSSHPWEIDSFTFSSDYNGYGFGYTNPQQLWNYQASVSHNIPMGGETCPGSNPRFSCSTAVTEMQALHYDYINSGYFSGAISTWKSEGCYGDIMKRIGYRYHLSSITYPDVVSTGQAISLLFDISNLGWGKLTRAFTLEAGLIHEGDGSWHGVGVQLQLFSAVKNAELILSGATKTLSLDFASPTKLGSYRLVVWLTDPSGTAAMFHGITFATEKNGALLWKSQFSFHETGVIITVV